LPGREQDRRPDAALGIASRRHSTSSFVTSIMANTTMRAYLAFRAAVPLPADNDWAAANRTVLRHRSGRRIACEQLLQAGDQRRVLRRAAATGGIGTAHRAGRGHYFDLKRARGPGGGDGGQASDPRRGRQQQPATLGHDLRSTRFALDFDPVHLVGIEAQVAGDPRAVG